MPEVPPNRVLRNYREIDPLTSRYKHPGLLEQFAYAVCDESAAGWRKLKAKVARAFRRLTWALETGEYPALCCNPDCITVVFNGAAACDRHQPPADAVTVGKAVRIGHVDKVFVKHIHPADLAKRVNQINGEAAHPELANLVRRTMADGGNVMDAMRARPDLTGLLPHPRVKSRCLDDLISQELFPPKQKS